MSRFLVPLLMMTLVGTAVIQPSWASTKRYLDANHLSTLNTQVRKVLSPKTTNLRGSINTAMASLNPEKVACDAKVNNSYGQCFPCMDRSCQDGFQPCSHLTLKMYSASGMSLNNDSIYVCYSASSHAHKTCTTFFKPDGFTLNSASQTDHVLTITLSKNSSGNGGIFINNGGDVFINNGGITQPMTDEEKAKLQQQMNHTLQSVGPNLEQMNTGLHQAFSNIGQSVNGFNNAMAQLSYNLSHMFDGSFLGRRRRRTHQSCTFYITDLLQNCPSLTQQCASCPGSHRDMMEAACGKAFVDKLTTLDRSRNELANISNEINNGRNIITQVEFDDNIRDPITAAYLDVNVTTNIHGIPSVLKSNTPLRLYDLVSSGAIIANQIWNEWMVYFGQPVVI